MTTTDKEIKELEAKLKAARADLAADERAEKAALTRAKKIAGDSHTKTMIKLYDLLDVKPELAQKRTVKNSVKDFAVDRDETLRSQRVLTMVESLLGKTDDGVLKALRTEDDEGRKDRQAAAAKARKEAAESSDSDSKSTTSSTPAKEPVANTSTAASTTASKPHQEPGMPKSAVPQSAQAELYASMS